MNSIATTYKNIAVCILGCWAVFWIIYLLY